MYSAILAGRQNILHIARVTSSSKLNNCCGSSMTGRECFQHGYAKCFRCWTQGSGLARVRPLFVWHNFVISFVCISFNGAKWKVWRTIVPSTQIRINFYVCCCNSRCSSIDRCFCQCCSLRRMCYASIIAGSRTFEKFLQFFSYMLSIKCSSCIHFHFCVSLFHVIWLLLLYDSPFGLRPCI